MKITDIGLVSLASHRLTHASAAQAVISENIANADTPGYQAKRAVSFQAFLERAREARESTMTDVEIQPLAAPWGEAMNGNNVSLEQEQLASNSLKSDHALASRLFRKAHDMVALAASKP